MSMSFGPDRCPRCKRRFLLKLKRCPKCYAFCKNCGKDFEKPIGKPHVQICEQCECKRREELKKRSREKSIYKRHVSL
jgi:hypothetical protein